MAKWLNLPVMALSLVLSTLLVACGGVTLTVVINSPASNSQFTEGTEVIVEATASGQAIVRVELWVDGQLEDAALSPSPQQTFTAQLKWEASGVGSHTLEAIALTNTGQTSQPAAITIEVTETVAEATATPTSTPEATPTPTSTPKPAATATPTLSPSPTPTPTPSGVTFGVSFDGVHECDTWYAALRVFATGQASFESARWEIFDKTTSQSLGTDQDDKPFVQHSGACGPVVSTLDPGEDGYLILPVPLTASEHSASATVKLCTKDGLGGNCAEQTTEFVFPAFP